MNIIIDVGANQGDFLISAAQKNPNMNVIGFEPIPSLMNDIKEKIRSFNISNILLRNVAISNIEGKSELNVSNELDQGVSSLLDIDRAVVDNNDYWKKRVDLEFLTKIEVDVKTLEHELSDIDFDRIRFIKIDVQGLDVEVLVSLGVYLDRVDAGMLEVPGSLNNKLYRDEVYDLKGALNYLDDNGFDVYKIKANDEYSNEFNVFFKKKGVDVKIVEQELCLNDIEIYSGRDYWHLPGVELVDYKTLIHQQKTELFQAKDSIHKLKTKLHNSETELYKIKNNYITFFLKLVGRKIKSYFKL